MLSQLTWREGRELNDLLNIEPVGGERLDWHFGRLMSVISSVMGKSEDNEPIPLSEWLLERMVTPDDLLGPELDDEDAAVNLDAALMGLRGLTLA